MSTIPAQSPGDTLQALSLLQDLLWWSRGWCIRLPGLLLPPVVYRPLASQDLPFSGRMSGNVLTLQLSP